MKIRPLPSWLAATTTAGALLTMVFVSGCQTQQPPPPAPAPTPDHSKEGPKTIHHPPGRRHHRHHHHAAPEPVKVGEPAPITHPGG